MAQDITVYPADRRFRIEFEIVLQKPATLPQISELIDRKLGIASGTADEPLPDDAIKSCWLNFL